VNDDELTVRPVGHVESILKDVDDAPLQGDEGGTDAWIRLAQGVEAAATDLAVGDRVVLLTWLHRADRDVLAVHPRGDLTRPETGVFSTRSQDRPNPIGLHEVEVLAVQPGRLLVGPLEAVDGTPVVDVKPVLTPAEGR
jgi:tRNA-Thr(GGU) m(6)t(6)A37 methyltransferase TsaA